MWQKIKKIAHTRDKSLQVTKGQPPNTTSSSPAPKKQLNLNAKAEQRRHDCKLSLQPSKGDCSCDASVKLHREMVICLEALLDHAPCGYTSLFLGSGKTHHAWHVVIIDTSLKDTHRVPDDFVIRIRFSWDSSVPLKVRNEVGARRYVRKNLPDVPCPKVFEYNEGCSDPKGVMPFIAEQFVDGKMLCSAIEDGDLTFTNQAAIIDQLAEIMFALGSTRFPVIGGFEPKSNDFTPHVEANKYNRFGAASYKIFNCGPYTTVEDYFQAMFEKEAFWVSDDNRFPHILSDIRDVREELNKGVEWWEEKFSLGHHDITGSNIMIRGNRIVGLLDWEWAAIMPVSEFWSKTGDSDGAAPRVLDFGRPPVVDVAGTEQVLKSVVVTGKVKTFDIRDPAEAQAYWNNRVKSKLEEMAESAGWASEKEKLGLIGNIQMEAIRHCRRNFNDEKELQDRGPRKW